MEGQREGATSLKENKGFAKDESELESKRNFWIREC